jgi:hypothetical protein
MKKMLMSLVTALLFSASVYAADKYEIYETTSTDAATSVFTGAGYLYKIIVSSAGASSFLTVADAHDTITSDVITGINTSSANEYVFKVAVTSGMAYQTFGGSPASVQILFRRGSFFPDDGQVFESSFTVTAQTSNLLNGAGSLYKVLVTSGAAVATGIDVFNSHQSGVSANTRILRASGASIQDDTYNVFISSGLSYTTTGTAGWTLIYKRGQ